MRPLTSKDWARYTIDDFSIQIGVDVDSEYHYKVDDNRYTCYTIRTRDGLHLMRVGLEHNTTPRQWIEDKIKRAHELVDGEIGLDEWEALFNEE